MSLRPSTSLAINRTKRSGGGTSPPGFVSAAINSLGTVSDNDRVILVLVNATAPAPAAPTGWLRVVNTNEAQGYGVGVYKSLYSAGNAVANITNFPVNNGYFLTIVYAGPVDILQIGTLSDSVGNSCTVTGLGAATGPSSNLLAWYSSRDPASEPINSSEGMTQRILANALSFFDASLWDQSGVQSGNRTFNRTGAGFNHFGMLFEIG